MDCPFSDGSHCEVSSLLAGCPVPIDDKVCSACRRNKNPMAINPVTCSRAAWAARKSGRVAPPEVLECIKAGQKNGPGTELKKILSKIVDVSNDCGCNGRANLMNIWGPDECERRIEEIVGWLREEANKKWPATKIVPIDWAIRNIIRRAINRARRKELRNKSKNPAGSTARVSTKVAG